MVTMAGTVGNGLGPGGRAELPYRAALVLPQIASSGRATTAVLPRNPCIQFPFEIGHDRALVI
jgi:hypothetical protein